MKRFLILSIFVLGLLQAGMSQPPFKGERVKALKIAFITQALNLTSDEAQKFWPVYNTYEAEIKKARQANLDDQLKIEEAVLNVRKKYKPEFKKILVDDARVNKVYKMEGDFREEIKKELQKRQKMRQKMMQQGSAPKEKEQQ